MLQSRSHYFSYIFRVFGTFLCCSVHISDEQLSLLQYGLPFTALPLSLPPPQGASSPGCPLRRPAHFGCLQLLPPVKCTSVSKTRETSINLNYTSSSPVVEAREGQSRASTGRGAQEELPLTCLSWCERRSHSFLVRSAPSKVNC